MPTYSCDICNFSTTLKNNYVCHVASKKHIRFTQIKPADNIKLPTDTKAPIEVEKVAPEFTCKHCDKLFRFRQSMNRHIKYNCIKNKDDSKEDVELLKKKLEQQETKFETHAQLLHKMMEKQSAMIDKLMRTIELHHSR